MPELKAQRPSAGTSTDPSIESQILMMKTIDSVYDLICILSDIENFDKGETIKARRIMLGQSETCPKIGRRA